MFLNFLLCKLEILISYIKMLNLPNCIPGFEFWQWNYCCEQGLTVSQQNACDAKRQVTCCLNSALGAVTTGVGGASDKSQNRLPMWSYAGKEECILRDQTVGGGLIDEANLRITAATAAQLVWLCSDPRTVLTQAPSDPWDLWAMRYTLHLRTVSCPNGLGIYLALC